MNHLHVLPVVDTNRNIQLVPEAEPAALQFDVNQAIGDHIETLNTFVPGSVSEAKAVMGALTRLHSHASAYFVTGKLVEGQLLDEDVVDDLDGIVNQGLDYWRLDDTERQQMTDAIQANSFGELRPQMRSWMRNLYNNDPSPDVTRVFTDAELAVFQNQLAKRINLSDALQKPSQPEEVVVEPEASLGDQANALMEKLQKARVPEKGELGLRADRILAELNAVVSRESTMPTKKHHAKKTH